MASVTQLTSTECCPSLSCLFRNPEIPDCMKLRDQRLPPNITGHISPERGQLDPGTSNWITYYDPASYTSYERTKWGFLLFFICLIGAIIVGAAISVCCRRSKKHAHEFPRTNTTSSAATNGRTRGRWPDWMKPQQSRSRSNTNGLPTHRVPGENMEMDPVSPDANRDNQDVGGGAPLTRFEGSFLHPHTTNSLWDPNFINTSRPLSPAQVWNQNRRGFARFNATDAPYAFRENESTPTYTEDAPPSYTLASGSASGSGSGLRQMVTNAAERRDSWVTVRTVGTTASWEGRPRTPPPAYGGVGGDRTHNLPHCAAPNGVGSNSGAGTARMSDAEIRRLLFNERVWN